MQGVALGCGDKGALVGQAFLPVTEVGQAFLPVIESVSGGHSCPPERIRVCSGGGNATTRRLDGRQECLPHQMLSRPPGNKLPRRPLVSQPQLGILFAPSCEGKKSTEIANVSEVTVEANGADQCGLL